MPAQIYAMAVYTEVCDEELEAFIASYGLGALLSFKGIAEGVENTNYLVHTESGPFILTLYEKRVEREDLPFFLGLMEHLAGARHLLPAAGAATAQGRTLEELAGRPAALVTFLEGLWVRRPKTEHCAGVGEALAQLHLAGAGFPMFRRATRCRLPAGAPLFETSAARADEIAPGLSAT